MSPWATIEIDRRQASVKPCSDVPGRLRQIIWTENIFVPEVDRSAPTERLRQGLTAAANQAGGWGYAAAEKRSRIEPTVLGAAGARRDDAAIPPRGSVGAPHLRFLTACQRADGLLVDQPPAPPNLVANGIAACVLAHLPSTRETPLLARLVGGLASVKGVSVDTNDSQQDNTLQGWPWIPDTFSWIEPTSWCLLASRRRAACTLPRSARSRRRISCS